MIAGNEPLGALLLQQTPMPVLLPSFATPTLAAMLLPLSSSKCWINVTGPIPVGPALLNSNFGGVL